MTTAVKTTALMGQLLRAEEAVRVHSTAIVEDGVSLGAGTRVWDHVHIRNDVRIGRECIVGEKSYIAYDVQIGDRVKVNAQVYICTGVTIEDGVMVCAGVTFTNDKLPRAASVDLRRLRPSAPDEHTRRTLVRQGATIGASATVGCDLEIGRFAMVGMGSVVTRSVPDFHLAFGNPARSMGCVCRCGTVVRRFGMASGVEDLLVGCPSCDLVYLVRRDGTVEEATPPA